MNNNELHAVIKELKEFKLLKEEAEARIAELESTIKAQMTEQNATTLIVEEYKCKLTTVNSKRLDQKAIEADLPEVYNKYIKPTSYQRFTVA